MNISKKYDNLLSALIDKYKKYIPELIENELYDDIATRQLGDIEKENKINERKKLKDNPDLAYKKITVFDKDKGVYIRNQLYNPNKDKKNKDNDINEKEINNTDNNSNKNKQDNKRSIKKNEINIDKINYFDFQKNGLGYSSIDFDDLNLKLTKISNTNKDEIIKNIKIKQYVNEKTKLYNEIIDDIQLKFLSELDINDKNDLENLIKKDLAMFIEKGLMKSKNPISFMNVLYNFNMDDKRKKQILIFLLYASGLRNTILENHDIINTDNIYDKISNIKDNLYTNISYFTFKNNSTNIENKISISLDENNFTINNDFIRALSSNTKHYADKLTLTQVAIIDIMKKLGFTNSNIKLYGATNYLNGLFGAGVWAYKGYTIENISELYSEINFILNETDEFMNFKNKKLLKKIQNKTFTLKDYKDLLNSEIKITNKGLFKNYVNERINDFMFYLDHNDYIDDDIKDLNFNKVNDMLLNISKKNIISFKDLMILEGAYSGFIRDKNEFLFMYNLVNQK